MSIIDLHNPLIIAMMNRPAKFITDQEMTETIGNLYNGMQADGLRAANQIATGFVRDYSGSFAYVLNAKRDVEQFDAVPSSKLKGILNVMRSAQRRQAEAGPLPGKDLPADDED